MERDLLSDVEPAVAGPARSWKRAALAAAAICLADQAFKSLVMARLAPREARWLVPGVLSVRHRHNPGAAFGRLSALTDWQHALLLCALPLAALALALWFARHLGGSHHRLVLAIGLIAGGAASNLLDRIVRGFVVDYVSFFAKNAMVPTYNVADFAIIAGIVLVLWSALVAGVAEGRH
ncbi:MAG TPA: signal peptidase II [Polyangiaceae bacterium]|nr:signal peptidase II [Polyangiaceae bacterium]